MYITVNDADDYFITKLHVDAWTDASQTNRVKALQEASRLLDLFRYVGTRTDEDQDHEFPRNDETTIPLVMQYACAEIALRLLDGFDMDQEIGSQNLVSQGFVSVRSTYDRSFVQDHIRHGIPSIVAWAYMKKYLRPTGEVRIFRVS